jgi:acyl-CoA synthetase (AMP-forming)/AMP-acid ligase II
MAILPLGHNYNLASPGLLGVFYRGGTLVIATSTDATDVFAAVARERVTVIAAVVPLITNWLNGQVARAFDLSSLRVVQNGGARLAPELRMRLREEFGVTPQEIYGTAEGLINMTRLSDPDDLLLESSGAPVSEFDEIAVLNDAGSVMADGESGELVTRGPYTIRGYYDAEGINADAFTPDGFYRMGDIVRKRGRYVFTEGRRKDLINRGGEKISCDEVENLIFGLSQVKQVAVVRVVPLHDLRLVMQLTPLTPGHLIARDPRQDGPLRRSATSEFGRRRRLDQPGDHRHRRERHPGRWQTPARAGTVPAVALSQADRPRHDAPRRTRPANRVRGIAARPAAPRVDRAARPQFRGVAAADE